MARAGHATKLVTVSMNNIAIYKYLRECSISCDFVPRETVASYINLDDLLLLAARKDNSPNRVNSI